MAPASAVSGADAGAIDTLSQLNAAGREARRVAVFDAPVIQADAARALRTHGDELLDALRPVTDHAKGALKADYVEQAITKGNEATTRKAVSAQLDGLIDGAEKLLSSPEGAGFAKSVESVSKAAYRAKAALEGAADGSFNARAFVELDQVKRDLQALASRGYKAIGSVGDPIDQALAKKSVEFFDEAAKGVRAHLEDSSLWGKAAENQAAVNAAWTKQIEASNRFHRALTTDVGRDPRNPYLQVRGVDPAKAESFVRNLVNPNADLTHQATREFVESSRELSKAIETAYDLPAAARQEVERIRASSDAFHAQIQRAEKSLVLANQFEAITKAEGEGLGALGGIVGGSALGGPIGGVLGAVAGAVSRPGKAIRQLAALERVAGQVQSRVEGGIKGFLSSKRPAVAELPSASVLRGRAGQTQKQALADSVAEVQKLAQHPELLQARLAQSMGDVSSAAPAIAAALTTSAVLGVAHLAEHAPAALKPDPEIPWHKPRPEDVSDFEMDEWARRAAVVNDWTVVLHGLKHGTLTAEEVDTFRTVHPQSYAEVTARLTSAAVAKQSGTVPLTWSQSTMLSTLFDVQTDPAATRSTIAAVQAMHMNPPAPPALPRPRTAKPISGVADMYETTTQRLEGRKKP